MNYLFYDIRDEKGNFYPESAVIILDALQPIFPKSKDMSFILENLEDYQNYFITEEMKEIFIEKGENYQQEILEKRKDLIINTEKEFVKKLNITYTN